MPLYRRLPVVVQARGPVELGNPRVMDGLTEWCGGRSTMYGLCLTSKDGDTWARNGCWVIQEIDGKFHSVPREVFQQSYEKVIDLQNGDLLIGPLGPVIADMMEVERRLT